ncbi:MAG: large subunit ribosomal protein L9 [Parcubacteria group bacterium Gr01-1014_29]|nr:MAG: large subunit ribosomal protein L9 [Parcubacteria group bacterium Gr01-1014_29]
MVEDAGEVICMQIILLKQVDNLGGVGDIKDVAAGFFRNFLMPRGLAKPATPAGIKEVEVLRARAALQDAKDREHFLKILDALKNEHLVVFRKATPEGHLFGSVTEHDVAELLSKKGYADLEKYIRLEDHIKALGTYSVVLQFDQDSHGSLLLAVERGD